MSHRLSFGSQQLELADPGGRIMQPMSPAAAAIRDPVARARQALAEPAGLPPLDQITVEGDQVVIAVGDASPWVPELVAVVVESLLEGPVVAENVTVVVPTGGDPLVEWIVTAVNEVLPEADRNAVAVHVHTPADQEALAYLAASKDALPIYLNRLIADADLVIPLGVARPDNSFGYHGVPGGLYPKFGDTDALSRFAAPTGPDWPARRKRYRAEADEVAQLAGILFTVQIVPGTGGGVRDVLAGLAEQIAPAAQQGADKAWSIETPPLADLVIATLDGDASEQTWDNLARALFTARSLATPDGAVVICSEIDQMPGGAIRSLAGFDSIEQLQRHLQRGKQADAAVASMIASTLEFANVFLMSKLDESLVEELGIAPLRDVEELERLVERHETVLLLPSAQHLALRPVSPADIVLTSD